MRRGESAGCVDGSGVVLPMIPDGRRQWTAYRRLKVTNCWRHTVFTIDPGECVAFQSHQSLVRRSAVKGVLVGPTQNGNRECHHLRSPLKDSPEVCSIIPCSLQKVFSNSNSSGKFPNQSVPGWVKQKMWLKTKSTQNEDVACKKKKILKIPQNSFFRYLNLLLECWWNILQLKWKSTRDRHIRVGYHRNMGRENRCVGGNQQIGTSTLWKENMLGGV